MGLACRAPDFLEHDIMRGVWGTFRRGGAGNGRNIVRAKPNLATNAFERTLPFGGTDEDSLIDSMRCPASLQRSICRDAGRSTLPCLRRLGHLRTPDARSDHDCARGLQCPDSQGW